jgi:hypothetical protein
VFATHQLVFGNALSTPYERASALSIYDVTKIPSRLYALTIDPMAGYWSEMAEKKLDEVDRIYVLDSVNTKTPWIMSKSFFLIFAPVGVIAALITMRRRERRAIIGWTIGFLLSSIFYLSFSDWHSGWTHWWRYYSTWMPSLVILATIGMLYIARIILKKLKSSGVRSGKTGKHRKG